ncbi:MAG: hypothetical protein QOC89_6216 [Paraburkholderia sp.]|nr:hypothetical protein [Paraburkholderia sp.]
MLPQCRLRATQWGNSGGRLTILIRAGRPLLAHLLRLLLVITAMRLADWRQAHVMPRSSGKPGCWRLQPQQSLRWPARAYLALR